MMFQSGHTVSWNGYQIFRLTESHYKDLVLISQSAFGITTSIEYYKLKNYTVAFDGIPNLGYIAYSENSEPAAFYGVFFCQMILGDKVIAAAQSGDTMTHKSHIGKGLFTKLAELTYELCRHNGIAFVFGFPNYNSYPGFSKKLQWEFPGKLREYRLRVFTLPFAKVAKKIPAFNFIYNPYKSIVNSFFKAVNTSVKSSVIDDVHGGVERSKPFVKYKMDVTGSYILNFGKAVLWVKTDGFLFVGDIKLNGESFGQAFKRLKLYARMIGADTIVFQTTENTPLDKHFSSVVSPVEGLPWGFRRLTTEVEPSLFRYVTADIDTF
ncbi:MAG: GNAT family N-acetyltransferase [Bacteroidota bacterium]